MGKVKKGKKIDAKINFIDNYLRARLESNLELCVTYLSKTYKICVQTAWLNALIRKK